MDNLNLPFIAATAILFFQVCFWALRIRDLIENMRWVPVLDPERKTPLPDDIPLISVIVPAHNEEAQIRECLESVLDQDYPRLELIVVDDRSDDATVSIAASQAQDRENVRIISVRERPQGWTGKCHALDVGVRHSAGEWLAFLDADSRLHRAALRECYAEAMRSRVSMVTLTPKFALRTFWEKVLQPAFVSMSGIIFPLARVNDPSSKVASANGMFYLIRRTAYDRIDGHRDVRKLAVEDIGIGKRVKAAGLGLLFANGRRVLTTQMYSGFRDTTAGWTRILSASINYDLRTALKYLGMHLLMSTPVLILALLVYVPSARELWPRFWFLLPSACALETLLVPFVYYGQFGFPRRYTVGLVLGQLMLIHVFAVIVGKIRRKDALQWRGTTYYSNRYEPTRLDPA